MVVLKKAWTAEFAPGLHVLSLESAKADPSALEHVSVKEHSFPASPTPEHPLRHVVRLGLFELNDLLMLREAIDKAVEQALDSTWVSPGGVQRES